MEGGIQLQKNGITQRKQEKNYDFFAAASELLADLPQRSQEIVKKRFGLFQAKPQTLEKIGTDYGITRERIRQIITDVVKKISLKRNEPGFKKAEDEIIFTIEANNGIIKKSEIIEILSAGDYREANALIFLYECSSKIFAVEEESIHESWVVNKKKIEKVKEVALMAQEILKKEKKLLTDKEIIKAIAGSRQDLPGEEILNYLKVLSGIEKNKFGKWGMADWAEINPKGTRERIYAIFKEKKTPLHFTQIAKLIDEYGLSKRKAHVQTIHNELIKNDRFVLIGRGIYALKEWGYYAGTIRDVLERIFRKNKKFLSKEEIFREVSKVRQVKKATVLINLSNDKLFVKQNNLYSVRTDSHRILRNV